jgi:hypothetical protein
MTAPIVDDEPLARTRIRRPLQHALSGRTATANAAACEDALPIAGVQAPRLFVLHAGTRLQMWRSCSERPDRSWQ